MNPASILELEHHLQILFHKILAAHCQCFKLTGLAPTLLYIGAEEKALVTKAQSPCVNWFFDAVAELNFKTFIYTPEFHSCVLAEPELAEANRLSFPDLIQQLKGTTQ